MERAEDRETSAGTIAALFELDTLAGKFGFYVVPYGFPMAQSITGESLNLASAVKVFAPLGGFGDVVSTYTQITAKEVEQAASGEVHTDG